MHELPDKNLDDIFREAANKHDFQFDENGWVALEKRLSILNRFSKSFWSFLGAGIFFLLVSSGFLLWKHSGTDKIGMYDISSEKITFETDSGKDTLVPPVNIIREEQILREESTDNTHSEKNLSVLKPDRKSGDNSDVVPLSDNNTIGSAGNMENSNRNDVFEIKRNNHLRPLDKKTPTYLSFNSTPAIGKDETILSPEEIIIPDNNHRPGVSLAISVGPDFSAVGKNGIGAGTYAGLFVDLHILEKLNLNLGVIHTRKNYPVKDEYSPLYMDFNTSSQVPDRVEIACHIIDIPINLNYNIFRQPGYRIFIGSGLSSYLMLTEEYSFIYANGYNQYYEKEYALRNENQHYFGIINFTVGYTNYINQRWAWQIEPFYKIPVQDIAEARVRLKSFGALISLKYRLR